MSFDISASGMASQRIRMNLIANNLANINTTRTEEGKPFRRRVPLFRAIENGNSFRAMLRDAADGVGGVEVERIAEDNSENAFLRVHDPHHPDANEEGFVLRPNINPVTEMVHLLAAVRAFEANVTAFNSAKQMARKALEIGT